MPNLLGNRCLGVFVVHANALQLIHPLLGVTVTQAMRTVGRDTKSRVYMCLKLLHILSTWRILASSLRERATVALMTGCGASRTKYRIGSEWRQEDPSGSFIRLRAREGQYGEIKQRDVRAVNRATDLRELIGRRHASLCLHAWVGCRSLTYLHGIVRPPASRLRLSCP